MALHECFTFKTPFKFNFSTGGGARGRLRNALIADSDDFAPIMGGGRFQLQTEDQESGNWSHILLIRLFILCKQLNI